MSDRRIDAFFYGLFMDIDILREADVAPVNPRRAYVDDFALRIGQRATLLPSTGGRAYGVAHPRRLCVTTCAKRRDHTSGIRNMLRVFSVP